MTQSAGRGGRTTAGALIDDHVRHVSTRAHIRKRSASDLWHNLTVPHTASRGPGRPPAAKAAETRERILYAARQVFSELGYDAATFQAIAIRADLTRPAINHYFASKRVLYQELVEQTNTLVVNAGAERAQAATSLVDRLVAFIEAAVKADEKDRSAAAFLVTAVLESQRHPELAQARTIHWRRRGSSSGGRSTSPSARVSCAPTPTCSHWWRCWSPCCGA